MNSKLLSEELLKQIKLINYDRSKTILEQFEKEPSDYLGNTGNFERQVPKIDNNDIGKKELSVKDPREGRYVEKSELEQRLCNVLSVMMWDAEEEKYFYHKPSELCKNFGGTELKYVDTNYLLTPANLQEPRYRCACKQNGEILIPTPEGGKTLKINDFIMNDETVGGKIGIGIYDWVHDIHNFLMVGSLVLTFFGGPVGAAVAVGLDLADAALYLEEGDPFMAGLMFLMVVIPFGKIMKALGGKWGGKKITKEILEKILKKLKLKKELTEYEKAIVEAYAKAEFKNTAFWRLFRMKLKRAIVKYDIFYFLRAIIFLVDKGLLATSFLLKFGLTIAGVYYTWYQISKWLGITEKEDDPIDKNLTPSQLQKNKLIELLQNAIDGGFTYSQKYEDAKLPIVALFQLLLQGYGTEPHKVLGKISKDGTVKFSNTSIVKEIKIYNVAGREIAKITNNSKNDNLTTKLPSEGVYILKSVYFNGDQGTGRGTFSKNVSELYNNMEIVNNNFEKYFKWGYYTPKTYTAVYDYQKQNGLVADGVVGPNTIKKLLVKLKNTDSNSLSKQIQHFDISFETIKSQIIEKKPTKEEIEEAYTQQKNNVSDSLDRSYDMELFKLKEKADSLDKIGQGLEIIIPE
jgi:peptidoglycan hydrolase-like protein with peptidoglycan-binding domain